MKKTLIFCYCFCTVVLFWATYKQYERGRIAHSLIGSKMAPVSYTDSALTHMAASNVIRSIEEHLPLEFAEYAKRNLISDEYQIGDLSYKCSHNGDIISVRYKNENLYTYIIIIEVLLLLLFTGCVNSRNKIIKK